MFCKIHAKGLVHSGGILEDPCKIWFEEDDVSPLPVPFVVLSTNATSKVVLRSHVVSVVLDRLLHMFVALQRSLRAH